MAHDANGKLLKVKAIYVREQHAEIWREAVEFAHESKTPLSIYVAQALNAYATAGRRRAALARLQAMEALTTTLMASGKFSLTEATHMAHDILYPPTSK